jgi:hypothetical protein
MDLHTIKRLKLLTKFWRVPNSNKVIALKAWYLFIYWNILISVVPYKYWKNKLFKNSHTFSDGTIADVISITQLIEKVARNHFVKINCLRRCAVQKQLLTELGFQPQLVFGVKKQQGKFFAHCWLTFNDQLINDSKEETSQYVALLSHDKNQSQILKSLK